LFFFVYSGTVSIIYTEIKTQHNPRQSPRTLLAWVLFSAAVGCWPPGTGLALAAVSGRSVVLLAGPLKASSLALSCSSYAVVGSLQRAA